MTTCAVLRCDEPATTRGPLASTSDVAAATIVDLCQPHREAVDGGQVDWRWEFEDGRVLMDPDDLSGDHVWLLAKGGARALQHSKVLERSSKPEHTMVLRLWIRRWGSAEEVDFELMLSREELAGLRDYLDSVLQMLDTP